MLFDFLDCVADLKGKEIKRAALNELVESVATSRGVLIEPLYPEAIKMVRWIVKERENDGWDLINKQRKQGREIVLKNVLDLNALKCT